ncbi:MAG: hypothetical protein KJZ86_18675 [Caldilineaceae bacterium]|nr:hypothetical protein [Caldilineaceae bacterium]
MQTMLHLAPRLAAAQEQRAARGVDGPDLTRITSFASLLPDQFVDANHNLALHLRKLGNDPLPPFYLERLLTRLDASLWTPPGATGTTPSDENGNGSEWSFGRAARMFQNGEVEIGGSQASQRAEALLQMAEPVLTPLHWQAQDLDAQPGSSERRLAASRRDAFAAALREGERIARLLEAHIIDPIRQDNLVPGDPFVQTTLYVVAPLYEPLAAALVWPTVAHLLRYLGRRHIAQVVAIFATGSYAADRSRVYEDASSYAALAEMEALTGLRPEGRAGLAGLVRGDGVEAVPGQQGLLDEWIGEPLFNRVYLVDREKSNQGLAQSSYELSVLVGNALQSLVTADGGHFVEEQLGIDLRNAHERPYSLLGASADYVPLDYLFQAVHQQEEKRLVREVLLRRTGEAARDGGDPSGLRSLVDLGADRAQVLAQLVMERPELFANVAPDQLSDLTIHPDFVLPPATALALRSLSPARWQTAFEEHAEALQAQFDEVAGAPKLDDAWGLDGLNADGLPARPGDRRLLPATAARLRAEMGELLAARPDSLPAAQRQLRGWREEIDEQRHALSLTGSGQQHTSQTQHQIALRDWQGRYARSAGNSPSIGGALLRSALVAGGVLLVALGYWLIFSRPISLEMDGGVLVGLVVGLFAGGLAAYRRQMQRIQKLRRERVALAQQELTIALQQQVQSGLGRVYDHLGQLVRQLSDAVEDALASLESWSIAEGPPPVPPAGVRASHLYRAHMNPKLWERCQGYLRSRQDREGRRSEERLAGLWAAPGWRRRITQLMAGSVDDDSLAQSLSTRIRELVQQAVTTTSTPNERSVRSLLVGRLAEEYNLEHLLWRDGSDYQSGVQKDRSIQSTVYRYLESLWSNAKPAANYDVSDRLAAHGITVDFAAVSGSPQSDLTESILRDFRVVGLPNGDPFQVTFVRTVHGLSLADLGSVQRYRQELARLGANGRRQVLLTENGAAAVYGVGEDAGPVQSAWR